MEKKNQVDYFLVTLLQPILNYLTVSCFLFWILEQRLSHYHLKSNRNYLLSICSGITGQNALLML